MRPAVKSTACSQRLISLYCGLRAGEGGAINRTSSGYAAKIMYEALTVEGQSHPTIAAAVAELVQRLQALGFTRLRTRANFKGAKYLAEKETWIEYPDPA